MTMVSTFVKKVQNLAYVRVEFRVYSEFVTTLLQILEMELYCVSGFIHIHKSAPMWQTM
jgi:TctA family transporter